MNKKLFFIFVIFTLIFIPFKVYGKEIIDIRKISDDQIVIAYDDNTIDVNGSIYENVKQFLSYYNRAYEGMYIDLDSNLYIERSGSKHLILENAIRILTNKNSYYTDSEFFIETQDNKIYKFNASTLKLELLEDSCKEVKFFDGETVYYTIDDTNDLYAVGKNTIGSKINNGEYLSERTLVLNNVKLIKDNLILTNNNELYIKSSDLPRPTFVMDGVIDFESKTNNLVYIVDSSNDVYRFYTYISDNVYVRRKEKINTSNIHKYDDSKTKTYSPGSDSFSYAVYAYVYTDEKVYCNDNLLLNDVIYFGEHYVLTSNGNLYIRSSSAFEESLNYSHLADVTYCEYQLVDRNVTQLMERQETSSYRTYLFYKKSDKSIWGLGAGNIFKLFDKSYSGYSYKMPFCVAGNCQPEVLLENVNINTVLVNQQFDFYANVYPSNRNFEVIWKSSDENIATVDNTGYITTHKPGVVTISATVNGVSDSVQLNVISDANVFEFDPNEKFNLTKYCRFINFNTNLGDYDNEVEITHSSGILVDSLTNGTDGFGTVRVCGREVGKQTVTFTSKNQKYSKTFEFTVRYDINDFTIYSIPYQVTTGKEIKPKIEIEGLTEGTDFYVTYENNIYPGTATVTINGMGYYYGTVTKTFVIKYIGSLNSLNIPKKIEEQDYTGQEIKPKIEIEGLTEGIDFNVIYKDNINIGRAKATIVGLTYSGTIDLYFYINPPYIKYTANDYEIYYDGLEHEIDLTVLTEDVEIYYSTDNVNYSQIIPLFKEPGTYTVYFKLSKANHYDTTGKSTITIKDLMYIEYQYNWGSSFQYDGNEHTINILVNTPGVTIKYMDEFGEYTLDNPPKYIDAGYHRIYFQLTKQNYHTITDFQTVIIEPLSIDYYAGGYAGTYDEQEHTVELQVNTPDVTIKYGTVEGEYNLDTMPKYIYPGEYILYVQLTKKNYQTVDLTLYVTIYNKGFSYGYGGYNGMYDGKEHGLQVDISTEYPEATVLFADEEGNYTLRESPKYSEIGQYTIKFMISAPYYNTSYGEDTVRIMGIKEEYSNDYKIIDDKYFVISSPKIYSINIKNVFNFLDLNVNFYINWSLNYDQKLKTADILTIENLGIEPFYGKEYMISVMGDVNADGEISPLDYVRIKNHIMGTTTLQLGYLIAADLNEDGEISPLDYVKVKNYIMNGGV